MNRKTLLISGLLTVMAISACTPTASVPSPTPTLEQQPAVPEPAPLSSEATEVVPVAPVATETEEPVEEVAIIPTSRGNELDATDPATVNIMSGKPQLIEFFSFW